MTQASLRSALLLVGWIWTLSASASQTDERVAGSGFIGYGITMYKPPCAQACRDSVSPYSLNCNDTNPSHMEKRHHPAKETPECYANNDRFLQSVAYCISQHCQDVEIWKIERWWTTKMPGTKPGQPEPKESYQQTLARVMTPPNVTIPTDQVLMDENTLVDEETWLAHYNSDLIFEKNEATHVRYGLVLLTTGAALPIALSLLRFVPFPRPFVSRFKARFIDPPAFGGNHNTPWLKTFIVPTRGQALFIAYLWMINVILCSVGYESRRPNSGYETRGLEIATYISYRTGVLSFSNFVLFVLYAGRNNVLIWVTSWSHGTFVLLHRWLAVICTVEACVHSALLLHIYSTNPITFDYAKETTSSYWYWGVVATIGMCVILATSILPIRQKIYEIFVTWHIIAAFIVLMAAYWHVVEAFGHQWGYETWIIIAFGCWGFDRLMRIVRIAKNGVRTATITVIDEDYIRLDILGVTASGSAYLYFPTLTWRVWKNHPFSVAISIAHTAHNASRRLSEMSLPSAVVQASEKLKAPEIQSSSTDRGTSPIDSARLNRSQQPPLQVGLSFFIRTHKGTTPMLRTRKTLPVLIESSYGHNVFGDYGGGNLAAYPNLICIVGGIGITAILPFLAGHIGRTKLYWGVSKAPLVEALHDTLAEPAFAGVEVEVTTGQRMNLQAILHKEIRADAGAGTMIVVSGPSGMADRVRLLTSKYAAEERGAVIAFVQESYSL